MQRTTIGVVLLAVAAGGCFPQVVRRPAPVSQRRFGSYWTGAAVVGAGALNERLRCQPGDQLPLLFGKVIELRDRVVLNPGGHTAIRGWVPDRGAAWRNAQIRAGEELSRCLRMVLEHMPSFHWAHANLAVARIAMAEAQLASGAEGAERGYKEDLTSASSWVDRLLKERPGYILAHLIVAELMALEGRLDAAAQRFQDLEARGVESSHIQAWLGFIAYQQQKPKEAGDRFRRSVQLDTDDDATAYARYALRFLDPKPVVRRGREEAPPPILYPPFLRPTLPRKPTEVTHFHMRVAVLNFIDQTHLAADLQRVVADRLTTELLSGGRFEVYDRQQLRDGSASHVNAIVRELKVRRRVDAVVSGAITHVDYKDRRAEVDVRAVATHDDMVLFAKRYTVPLLVTERRVDRHTHRDSAGGQSVEYQMEGTTLFGVDDNTVKRIANELLEAFPRVGDGRITELAPSYVVVDKGSRDRVFRGMTAYVEAMIDDLVDPKAPAGSVSTGLYVGQLYIFSVQPSKSLAVCFRTDRASLSRSRDKGAATLTQGISPCVLRVGDVVRFK